ncbi:MAG TPA: DNA-packaging protein [Pelagibacterium sp.]|uniref:head-tail connector protein n=1 Tax=uncultured Pelagibacterium sp. TaxID=1159875 RepID=UPI000C43DD86|nr:DNA-packaging protein [Pelagibacterium sp.]HCO54689.1 DNA-packaging protein [Pelagibacterium sp.]|tara:strand:+ start:68 stop:385 length:318 start_codon:yes stop_codon:yes gene_type:complete
MALTTDDLKNQINMGTDGGDAIDTAVLPKVLAAATKHVENFIGYALDDTEKLPDGAPADLEHAVLMIAAHWYEERETVLVGVSGQEIPFGASQILGEYREYSYGG